MPTKRTLAACVAACAALWVVAPAGAAVPHTVQPGETLWSIAAASNFTTRALAAYNGLPVDAQVVAGSTIQVPSKGEAAVALGTGQAAPAPRSMAQQGAGTAGAAQATSGWAPATSPHPHPHPTNERTNAAEVGGIATAHAVSGPLAAGVGWQESGFNNALVSSAGARGVMQIMPSTWDWIQRNLASYPLSTVSARENVHAGVMYLQYLLRQTGDLPTAVASYYQGLDSVRRQGLFHESEHYVQDALAHARRFGGP